LNFKNRALLFTGSGFTLQGYFASSTLFPKKTGSIKELKSQGQLEKKQVMKEHGIDCHEKMKAEGRKTGPRS
jgi:hypothetical protein